MRTCPADTLPPHVARARRDLDAVSEKQAAADAAFQDALRLDAAHKVMREEVTNLRSDVAAGEAELVGTTANTAAMLADLENWRHPQFERGKAAALLSQMSSV